MALPPVNAASASVGKEPSDIHTFGENPTTAARGTHLSECLGSHTIYQIGIVIRILVAANGALSKVGSELDLAERDSQSKNPSSTSPSPGLDDLRFGRARTSILVEVLVYILGYRSKLNVIYC